MEDAVGCGNETNMSSSNLGIEETSWWGDE